MPILQKRKLRHRKVESTAQAPPTIKAQLSSPPHPSPSSAAKNKSDSLDGMFKVLHRRKIQTV